VSQAAKARDTMRAIFAMSIHAEGQDSIYLLTQCA